MDTSDRIFLKKLCREDTREERARWEHLLESVIASPKAELHCHLAGSMRPETMKELAETTPGLDWSYCNERFGFEVFRKISEGDIEKVKRYLEYRKPRGSLSDYMIAYALPKTVLANEEAIRKVVFEVCEDNYREGVRYLEIRFNPKMISERVGIRDYIKAVVKGLDMAEERFQGLRAVLLLSLVKDYDAKTVEMIFDEVMEVNGTPEVRGRVKGVDSAGNEIGFSITSQAGVFEKARKAGLGIVCHAGEAFRSLEEGISVIQEAIGLLGAKRIGHGLAAGIDARRLIGKEDLYGKRYDEKRVEEIGERQKRLRRRLREEGVLIEVCPSSNVHTGNLVSISEHPLGTFITDGIPLAICTDNRWISHTKLNWEIVRMAKCLDLDFQTLDRIIATPFQYTLEKIARPKPQS